MITAVQRRVLVFIARYIAKHGTSPSYNNICDGTPMASKGDAHRVVTILKTRGLLKTGPERRSRTIELTDLGREWAALGKDSVLTPERQERRSEVAKRVAASPRFLRFYEFAVVPLHARPAWQAKGMRDGHHPELLIECHCGAATIDDLDNLGPWQTRWDELLKQYEAWVLKTSGLAA